MYVSVLNRIGCFINVDRCVISCLRGKAMSIMCGKKSGFIVMLNEEEGEEEGDCVKIFHAVHLK